MRTTRQRFVGIAWFIIILVFVSGMIAAAFFLTGYFYRITHWYLPPLLTQIVNALLGLLFTGTIIGMFQKVARSRGWFPEMNVFQPIIEALEKIARGDFSVRLEKEIGDHQMVGELARSVNKMALELDQMENMRQEFVSNVSHEIQSPLTSIRGFAQALENDQLSAEERHHYLGIIENESTRLSRLADDLLKLASLDSEHAKFEPKPYRLDKQIRSLILTCEPQWAGKGINFVVSLKEVSITADEDLLSQVWLNLIHNGIKFTPQGGEVRVLLAPHGDRIEFCISDTGIGISEDDQVHLFERFYKADKSRTRLKEGSGLGLSIVKKIVDMHKGSIEIKSKLDQGTTFIVSLPAEK
jgi:two-component system, OmpR family, phosphate regulon sensor histidine kinase PhoR